MNHLSSQELSGLLAGSATPEQEQHCRECAECRTELARFEETLSAFRGSLKMWASRQPGGAVPHGAFLENGAPRLPGLSVRWLLASAALVTVVAAPFYWRMTDMQRARTALEDSLLLEQVNAHLSRAVPSPMEPLLDLVLEGYVEESGGRQ